MFLVPPKVSFLPTGTARNELLSWGDPQKLRDGVTLTDKRTKKGKIIYSLYDLELNVKYQTDQHGVVIERIADNRIAVKKKATKNKKQKYSPNELKITDLSSAMANINVGRNYVASSAPLTIAATLPDSSYIPRSNPIKIPEPTFYSNGNSKKSIVLLASSVESEASSVSGQTSESVSLESKGGFHLGFSQLILCSGYTDLSQTPSFEEVPNMLNNRFVNIPQNSPGEQASPKEENKDEEMLNSFKVLRIVGKSKVTLFLYLFRL
jgi:hypothetical protein